MLGAFLSVLSPAGARARLSVLIFHRVLPEPDPIFPGEVDARRFADICRWLGDWFHVLALTEAVARLRAGTLPARAAAITFDDGYRDNHDVALPILQRHGLHATFFVASGFLDGGRMWNDGIIEAVRRAPRGALGLDGLIPGLPAQVPLASPGDRRQLIKAAIAHGKYLPPEQRENFVERLASRCGTALPSDLMMRSEQVVALGRAGMGIGAHTLSHPILARLASDAARQEIVEGRRRLEALTGGRIGLFAYPNGKPGVDYHAAHVEMVRELGFDAALSTAWGCTQQGDDLFQIRRFTPWDRGRMRFGLRLAMNLARPAEPVAAATPHASAAVLDL